MSFEPREFLRHIQLEADYLVERSHGVTFEAFASDPTLSRAFVRSLEIIGEAAKKVPLETSGRSTPRSTGAAWPACATD